MILPRPRSLVLPQVRVNTSAAVWRGRAVRYLFIYLFLALSLTTARYFTKDLRTTLRNSEITEGQLTTQRAELEVQFQSLISQQKVGQWARAHGMVPFAELKKEKRSFEQPLQLPLPLHSNPFLEVNIQWK